MSNKPLILIIGHGRHGKDTVAAMFADLMNLKFSSSSDFVGKKVIWPMWGKERYKTYEEMFEDRVNYRKTWGDLIEAYCTPNADRTAREMFEEGNHMYVGMRRKREYDSCMANGLFNYVIWVDASDRVALEGKDSNELNSSHADFIIKNNGSKEELLSNVKKLQKTMYLDGFDVNYVEQSPSKGERLTWMDKPANAVTVLDHGFFEVKEVMGSDSVIAESARMSYGRGTKKVNDNKGLLNYLIKNHHTSPIEMGEIRFHMRLPIFVMRQLVRHRTANLNEYSGRYSKMVKLFYVPNKDKICFQDSVNKQASGKPLPDSDAKIAQDIILKASNDAFDSYQKLLDVNVSRETARIVLPLNTYTECVWKLDTSNLIKFLYLRDDEHAQWEIRVYAKKIAEAVEHFFPLVYEAYMRERSSVKLTVDQINAIINNDFNKLSKSETDQVKKLLEMNNKH
jgi:thymidylate synthase (FAD)